MTTKNPHLDAALTMWSASSKCSKYSGRERPMFAVLRSFHLQKYHHRRSNSTCNVAISLHWRDSFVLVFALRQFDHRLKLPVRSVLGGELTQHLLRTMPL